MAVAFDAATESVRTGTTDPHTFTHTPVGTPRGVILAVVHGVTNINQITAVTYGGVEMTSYAEGADTATELGRAYMWFLGSGIPTGPQTVSIDLTSATTTDIQFVCMTVTASDDTSVVTQNFLTNNQANPSLTMNVGGLTSMAFAAFYGGGASPADFTPNGSCVTVHDHDFGAFYAEVIRQSTVSSSDFAIGGTAATDDVGFAAISITDAANVTITAPAAPAGATPATPEGADVTIGPSAAASVADGSPTVVSTPAGITVAPPSALATAAPATPDGLDKTVGVLKAQAAAAGSLPTVSTPGGSSATVSLTGIRAEATASGNTVVITGTGSDSRTVVLDGITAQAAAAPATPEGVDVTVGPSAAAAAADGNVPDIDTGVPGAATTVIAVAAQATAVAAQEDPFPWGEEALPPALGVTVAPAAAESTAGVVGPAPSVLVGVPQATATGSVGETRVGRPVTAPAAEATAEGNVPTDVGDTVTGADVSPTAATATAGVTAPALSVSINAPYAAATAAARLVARHGSVNLVPAQAAASGSAPTDLSVVVGVTYASATAACDPTVLVKTGSAHIFSLVATATAHSDLPRSIGIKDFVRLIPRPSADQRTLVPLSAASTLVLTPLEEQVE